MKCFLYWLVRLLLRPLLTPWMPVAVQRAWVAIAAVVARGRAGVVAENVDMGSVPARRFTPPAARPGHALLYLHGGGYVFGGFGSHGKFASHVAHATQSIVFLPDYRLAPEHPFPAALDDALAAYHWLLGQRPPPSRIVIAGDSAGGGLALAAAMRIREQRLPAPSALVLISPWADLTLGGESHRTVAGSDPMLRTATLRRYAGMYAGTRLTDPLVSPAFGNLAGLPPTLVQVGSEEILLSDAERVAQGTGATLSRYEGLWHVFQVHAGMLAEADRALGEIGAFVGVAHA